MSKTISADGVTDGTSMEPGVTGYTVIEAVSLDAAAEACVGHPHITYGGQVTVSETFEM